MRGIKTELWSLSLKLTRQGDEPTALSHTLVKKTQTHLKTNHAERNVTQEETRQTKQQMDDADMENPVEHQLNPQTDFTQWSASPLAMCSQQERCILTNWGSRVFPKWIPAKPIVSNSVIIIAFAVWRNILNWGLSIKKVWKVYGLSFLSSLHPSY